MIFSPYLPRLDDHRDGPRRAAWTPIKSSRHSNKIFFKHRFESEFWTRNPMAGVPIVVQQTDKLCSTGMTVASFLKRTVSSRWIYWQAILFTALSMYYRAFNTRFLWMDWQGLIVYCSSRNQKRLNYLWGCSC